MAKTKFIQLILDFIVNLDVQMFSVKVKEH